ncbi:MAG: sterol desaturase family protein [Opitutaceae bacterium]|nr:sterol desaturase family protein [Opitutaceae bacterium]
MEIPLSAPYGRPVLAAAVLVALLAWETAQPYFPLFGRTRERARHGVLNLALGALNAAVVALVFAGLWLAVTQWAAVHRFGLLNLLASDLAPWMRAALAVLLLDAWTYGWHWLNHRVPFFWRFHRWHHADRAMDVTTASRFHTGEIVLSSILRVPVLLLIGCGIGELALYELMLFAVVQFHHANLALPERLDRVLRLVIVTPALHKVHHSIVRAESDSNYSSLFSWWDRVFRTLRLVRDPRRIVFGVEE